MRFLLIAALGAVVAACSDPSVVTTGEAPPRPSTTVSATPTGRVDPNLVDAHAYYVTSDDVKGYYFATPSGKWTCAIIPHSKVGCQNAGAKTLTLPGAPDTVQTVDGDTVAPNAIAVGDTGEPGFTWVDKPGFAPPSGAPLVLDFTKTLAAAGFRCDVQQAGVSCENESTQKGFTFSSDSYVPQYTPVPG
ncbi:MAG TPA: hypothetical protein VFB19_14450 [Mycobacterium sp.]|nr:hypothetical protein [Mycobacterium sp.]